MLEHLQNISRKVNMSCKLMDTTLAPEKKYTCIKIIYKKILVLMDKRCPLMPCTRTTNFLAHTSFFATPRTHFLFS